MANEPDSNDLGTRANWQLLVPVLCGCVTFQVAIQLARIASSYEAVALGLPASSIGMLSAAFALLPLLLAVKVGRLNDRGGAPYITLAGGLIIPVAIGGLLFLPGSFATLFAATAILGLGQMLMLSSLQIAAVHCSGDDGRDRVLSNFSVAMALGQFLGPLMIGLLVTDAHDPAVDRLFASALVSATVVSAIAAGIAALLFRLSRRAERIPGPPVTLATILRQRGMVWLVLAGSMVVTANDLTMVYLPAVGVEREIEAGVIGAMLAVRAAMVMMARFLLVPSVRLIGRRRTIFAGLAFAAASLGLLLAPLPIWAMFLSIGASGFGLGLAMAAVLSLTLNIAPKDARATALSLRMTANRLGQFIIPATVGAFTGLFGVSAVFGLIGLGLAVSSVQIFRRLERDH